jgi:class 3 adenylate cyclase
VAEPRRKEHKFATALFADIVGSTTLAEREDPEIVQSIVGRAFDRLAEEVARHEGLLEKFMGDAILAVFGVPRAHEDDAERAVRARGTDRRRSRVSRARRDVAARALQAIVGVVDGFLARIPGRRDAS